MVNDAAPGAEELALSTTVDGSPLVSVTSTSLAMVDPPLTTFSVAGASRSWPRVTSWRTKDGPLTVICRVWPFKGGTRRYPGGGEIESVVWPAASGCTSNGALLVRLFRMGLTGTPA